MLREMTADQLDEWIAYYQLEPWGILAEDALAAHWKAIYVNAHRQKGKRAEKVNKFLIFKDKQVDASALFESEDEWQM